jgi:hypothetical protein
MGAGNTSNPATIKKPANTQVGDVLVVGLMFEKGQAPTITPLDEGWVPIQRVNQGNQVGMATFYKIVNSSSEPETYRFRINQSPKWNMGITRVTGADINHPDGPISAFSGNSGMRAFEATAPSLSVEDNNSMVMLFFTNKTKATWTPPSGAIEVYDVPNDQEGLTSNMMAYFIKNDPGNTGNMTAIASLSEDWVAQAIAIRPGKPKSNTQSARVFTGESESDPDLILSEENPMMELDEISGQIKVYPNPVKDRLNLSLKGSVVEEPNDNSLVIFDALGRVQYIQRTWHPDESRLELDFSSVGKGLYVINIRTLQGIKTIRVMKQL